MAADAEIVTDNPFADIVDLDRAEGIRQELTRLCLDPACMERQERLIPRFEPWAGPDGRITYRGAARVILERVECPSVAEADGAASSL